MSGAITLLRLYVFMTLTWRALRFLWSCRILKSFVEECFRYVFHLFLLLCFICCAFQGLTGSSLLQATVVDKDCDGII